MLVLLSLFVVAGVLAVVVTNSVRSSTHTTGSNAKLPATVVIENGTAVTYFPPPAGVTDTRPSARATVTSTSTAIVTLTATLQERSLYSAPKFITLQEELGIPAEELAQLTPSLSEHRSYRPDETPDLGVTDESRQLAKQYVAAINEIRVRQGLPDLIWDDDLAARAEGHATTRLWYFLFDGGYRVSGPRSEAIDGYFGVGFNPRYSTIGMSSHAMPTSILTDASDQAALMDSLTGDDGQALYGAAALPVTRIGVGISMAKNGDAPIPHGWLTILFQ